MSKKELKKEIKRLNKIIDALVKCQEVKVDVVSSEPKAFITTTTNDYIGGRPNDRP